MSDIFISYAREDRKTAQRLAEALESEGWSVWWDARLHAGEDWRRIINRELAAARYVIVLWSQASVENNWVLEEAEKGRERRILVPVKIEDVQLPIPFGGIHTVDLIDWNGHGEHPGFKRLMADVTKLLEEPRQNGPEPKPPPSPPDNGSKGKTTDGFLKNAWAKLDQYVATIKGYFATIVEWRPRKWHLAVAGGIALLVFGGIAYSLCEPEHDWELFKKVYAFASDPLAGMSMSSRDARDFAELWTLKCRNKDLNRFKEVYLYASDPLAGMSMLPRDAKEYALKSIHCTGAIESE